MVSFMCKKTIQLFAKLRLSRLALMALSVLFAQSAQSMTLDELLEICLRVKADDYITSLGPNEWQPEKSRSIFAVAKPNGVYAGVGADRAVTGLVLTPNAVGGLFVDIDPRSQLFHRINNVLGLSAENSAEYRRLRFATDFSQWSRLQGNVDAHRLKLDPKFFNWWKEVMTITDLQAIHDPSKGYFRDVNYLYNEELFTKYKNLIPVIVVARADITNILQVRAAIHPLELRQQKISVLDTSNVFSYIKAGEGILKVLAAFASVLTANSILLQTEGAPTNWWTYVGMRVSLVPRLAPSMTIFRIHAGEAWDREKENGYIMLEDEDSCDRLLAPNTPKSEQRKLNR